MGLEVLIIPLIALGVWILGTVFAKAEQPGKRRPVRLPGEGGRTLPRTTTDLDRFLEEARRRREASSQRRGDPAPAAEIAVPPRPAPRAEPPRPQRASERRPARSRETVPQPSPSQREEPRLGPAPRRPIPPPASTPPTSAPAQGIVVAEVAETLLPAPVGANYKPLDKPPKPDTSVARRPLAPIPAQVLTMLQTPRSAAAAFLLREILDPPLCKRRGGR